MAIHDGVVVRIVCRIVLAVHLIGDRIVVDVVSVESSAGEVAGGTVL